MKLLLGFLIFTLGSVFTSLAATIPIQNPGAETNDLSGWILVNSNGFSGVNASPILATEGTHSFYLSDGSDTLAVGMYSAPPNRISTLPNTLYSFSFDALIEIGSPTFRLRAYTSAFGNTVFSERTFRLAFAGDFFATASTVNGFTSYEVRFSYTSASFSGPLFYEAGYFPTIDPASTVDAGVYIDKMSASNVPEASTVFLFIVGTMFTLLTRGHPIPKAKAQL